MIQHFNFTNGRTILKLLVIITLLTSFSNDNAITITTNKLIYFSGDTIKIFINNNTSDTLYGNISNEIFLNDSSSYTNLFDVTNAQSHLKIKIEPDTFLPNSTATIAVKAGTMKPKEISYVSEKLSLRSAVKFGTILAKSEKFTILNDW